MNCILTEDRPAAGRHPHRSAQPENEGRTDLDGGFLRTDSDNYETYQQQVIFITQKQLDETELSQTKSAATSQDEEDA